MNISKNTSIFPSYNKIHQQILDKQNTQQQKKINKLVNKLNDINKKNNFVQDHKKIKQSILNMAAQKKYQQDEDDNQVLAWQKNKKYNCNNQESINYFIQDDKQEQNNYQSYLKFKKKALERDLQQDFSDKLTCKQRKKQQEQEQQLFRNLYVTKKNVENKSINSKSMKNLNNKTFQYQKIKQKASNFMKNINKNNKNNTKSRVIPNQKIGSIKEINLRQSQFQTYQKNKKYLIQNYMDILKKMEGTNIVKWRILNK